MALLWIEGFEGFGTSIGVAPSPTGIMSRKYTVVNEVQFDIETGRYDGYCMEVYRNNDYFQSPNLTTDDTVILGVAVQVANLSAYSPLLSLYDGTTKGINLTVNTDGTIIVKNNTVTLGTTTFSISAATWFYIELKVLTHNTTGTVDLKINGASWLSLSNQDTQPGANAYHTAFRIGPVNYIYILYDDIYFLDSTGSANNDFLGNMAVAAIHPDGAGDTTQWTPSAGSNYQNVDEGGLLDEDTTYNSTSDDADQDLYTFANLAGTVTTVAGLQIMVEPRVDAGSMDVSTVVKTGTTTSVGSPNTITSTVYVTTTRLLEQDPDTAAAWIPSGVNGAQFGIKANT